MINFKNIVKILFKNKYFFNYISIFSFSVSAVLINKITVNIAIGYFHYNQKAISVIFIFSMLGGITGSVFYMKYLINKV